MRLERVISYPPIKYAQSVIARVVGNIHFPQGVGVCRRKFCRGQGGFLLETHLLLGICFWREAPEAGVGPDRWAGKRGLIPHQHIRVHDPTTPDTRLVQRIEKFFTPLVAKKYIPSVVAATHHVIHRTLVFNSYRPRHAQQSSWGSPPCQSTIHGLTPL